MNEDKIEVLILTLKSMHAPSDPPTLTIENAKIVALQHCRNIAVIIYSNFKMEKNINYRRAYFHL